MEIIASRSDKELLKLVVSNPIKKEVLLKSFHRNVRPLEHVNMQNLGFPRHRISRSHRTLYSLDIGPSDHPPGSMTL